MKTINNIIRSFIKNMIEKNSNKFTRFYFGNLRSISLLIFLFISVIANALTYTSIADGNWTSGSTWQGGNVPPQNIGLGDIVNITHNVSYSNNLNIDGGILNITNGGYLTINGNILIKSGELNVINASIVIPSGAGGVTNEGGTATLHNALTQMGSSWVSKGGVNNFTNGCLITGQNYQNDNATDQFDNVCITVGLDGSGNYQIVKGTVTFSNNVSLFGLGTSGGFSLGDGTINGQMRIIDFPNGSINTSSSSNGSVNLTYYCTKAGEFYDNGNIFQGETQNCNVEPCECVFTLPTAENDSYSICAGVPTNLFVLNNDSYEQNIPTSMTLTVISAPSNGTAIPNDNGTPTDPTDDYIVYTPNSGFTGSDSFTYQITDSDGDDVSATVDVATTPDSDSDGISDNCDLDDDNDGILDTEECNVSTSTDEIMGGSFPSTETTITPKSGVVTGLTYATSHPAQNGYFTYESVRAAEVVEAAAKATFFNNGQATNLGQIELYADQFLTTTQVNSRVVSNVFLIRDFDSDDITFTIEVWNKEGKIVNASDLNVAIISGPATLSSVTDLGGGVFEYTITHSLANHNTHIEISSNIGAYLDKLKFHVTDNPNYSGEKLAFRSVRSIQTCVDTDNDGLADYLDTDSDNDGCPDAIEGAGTFDINDIDENHMLSGSTNNDGIPISAGTGQAIGSSIDASVTDPDCDAIFLPVELINFTAQKEKSTSLLNWATATETNNSLFEVQHSVNGIDFKTIGITQSPNGNSNTIQDYDFTHQNPIQGNNYYRLKQVDFDGAFEYTDIKVVNFASESKLSLYPNPTKSELNINLPTDIENIVSIEVINSVGQVVRVLSNHDNETSKKLKFQLNDLESGFYMIQVQTANQVYREQFIISK